MFSPRRPPRALQRDPTFRYSRSVVRPIYGHVSDEKLNAETLEAVSRRSVGEATLKVPALTVSWHTDPSRVGDRAVLWPQHGKVEVSRSAPLFDDVSSGASRPLAEPTVSRSPVVEVTGRDNGVVVSRRHPSLKIRLGGADLTQPAALSEAQLDDGVTLELGANCVLLLDRVTPLLTAVPDFGLVGESEALVGLRREIARVAPVDVKVLIRGETGTGKELVAGAIHAHSSRATQPYAALNMGAMQAALSASELFGHVRGAFSGAVKDHQGAFRAAAGGTVFLDEVAETPTDVQAALLRTLETGEVRPVGAELSVHPDVRVIAATDADLEDAIGAGRFLAPLLHRLSEYVVSVPPLRERRSDIARLLVHFLRGDLAKLNAGERLTAQPKQPWLAGRDVAELVRFDWPGNVRQLRNIARQIAIANAAEPMATFTPAIRDTLQGGGAEANERLGVQPTKTVGRQDLSDVSEDALVTALRKHRFRREAAAKELGISKTSIYALIAKSSRVRNATDLTDDEIATAGQRCSGDVDRMAQHLEVSTRALKLRMKR